MKKTSLPLAAALLAVSCSDNSAPAADTARQQDSAPAREASQVAPPDTPEAAGRIAFNQQCAICHTVKEGDAHRIGPNLFGVYERPAGTAEGFSFSAAMRDSDLVWNDENLNALLVSPQTLVRGTRMAYAGERDAQTRAAMIAYLKSLKPAGD